jgi:hypothetical protein
MALTQGATFAGFTIVRLLGLSRFAVRAGELIGQVDVGAVGAQGGAVDTDVETLGAAIKMPPDWGQGVFAIGTE